MNSQTATSRLSARSAIRQHSYQESIRVGRQLPETPTCRPVSGAKLLPIAATAG